MTRLRQLFHCTRFYIRHSFASLTVSCCFIYGALQYGLAPLLAWLPLKAIISVITLYFLYHYDGKQMYHYYNLHISVRKLLGVYLAYDLLLFFVVVCVANAFRSA